MEENGAKQIVFASDFHLGLDLPHQCSLEREKCIVKWLDSIMEDTSALYLVGDIFDFWFEYGTVIPKGFSLFLSKLKQFQDRGIEMIFFTGNHDMWMKDYFIKEYGIQVFKGSLYRKIGNKQFYIAHGDGLGKGDRGYKLIKSIFSNRLCQFLFSMIHPDIGLRIMRYCSQMSRDKIEGFPEVSDTQLSKDRLYGFAEKWASEHSVDFFIFGHHHKPLDIVLQNGNSRYINLGDWLNHRSYAIFSNEVLTLKSFL